MIQIKNKFLDKKCAPANELRGSGGHQNRYFADYGEGGNVHKKITVQKS